MKSGLPASVANMAREEQIRIIDGREVRISSPDKPYFPKVGLTKGDIVDYFVEVGEPLLNTARRRPTLLQRFPNGVKGKQTSSRNGSPIRRPTGSRPRSSRR